MDIKKKVESTDAVQPMIRVTRTLVVSANISLDAYGGMTEEAAIAYEQSITEGEEAWEQIQALVAVAEPRDIATVVRTKVLDPQTHGG